MYKHVLYLIDAILFKKQHLNKKNSMRVHCGKRENLRYRDSAGKVTLYDVTLPSSEGM